MAKLFLNIKFYIYENRYETESNMKKEYIGEIITDFLQDQIGKGEDKSIANEKDIYTIGLTIDLIDDSIICSHDCNNNGLRDGILLNYLKGI
jgi:hypothetical protein